MAEYVLKNCGLIIGPYDLSNCHNSISLTTSCKTIDATVFGDASQVNVAGTKSVDLTSTGYWDSTYGHLTDLGLTTVVRTDVPAATVMPEERTVIAASPCAPTYIFKPSVMTYTPIGGSVGEMRKFTTTVKGWGDLYRGSLLHYGDEAAVSGNGTPCNCGAVALGQTLYCALQYYKNLGDTNLIFKIQSAPTESFVSITDRITFTTIAAGGTSEWKTLTPDPAITDAWWRCTWAFTGAAAAGFSVSMAIL
jgi:hypothetical protein